MSPDYLDFQDRSSPVGYLITFRGYGTWLHGDARGSVDRFHRRYGTPRVKGDVRRRRYERGLLKQRPVVLNKQRRAAVESGIRETCNKRGWSLWELNVRSNHVHSIVSAKCKPELILNALKANATRFMREAGCWKSDLSPWSYRGSKKYLWTEEQLADAISYVKYDQGEPLD